MQRLGNTWLHPSVCFVVVWLLIVQRFTFNMNFKTHKQWIEHVDKSLKMIDTTVSDSKDAIIRNIGIYEGYCMAKGWTPDNDMIVIWSFQYLSK